MIAKMLPKRVAMQEHTLLWKCIQNVRFKYLDADAVILHEASSYNGYVFCVGHPEHGSYDWVTLTQGPFVDNTIVEVRYSNAGYGSSGNALRDGLIVLCEDHPQTDPAYSYAEQLRLYRPIQID